MKKQNKKIRLTGVTIGTIMIVMIIGIKIITRIITTTTALMINTTTVPITCNQIKYDSMKSCKSIFLHQNIFFLASITV